MSSRAPTRLSLPAKMEAALDAATSSSLGSAGRTTSGRARRARDQQLRHWSRRCAEERKIGIALGRHHSAPPVDRAEVGIFGQDALHLLHGMQETLELVKVRVEKLEGVLEEIVVGRIESLLSDRFAALQQDLRMGFKRFGREELGAQPCARSQRSPWPSAEPELQQLNCENEYFGIAVADAAVQVGSVPVSTRQLRATLSDASTTASLKDTSLQLLDSWCRFADAMLARCRVAVLREMAVAPASGRAMVNRTCGHDDTDEDDDTASIATTVACHVAEELNVTEKRPGHLTGDRIDDGNSAVREASVDALATEVTQVADATPVLGNPPAAEDIDVNEEALEALREDDPDLATTVPVPHHGSGDAHAELSAAQLDIAEQGCDETDEMLETTASDVESVDGALEELSKDDPALATFLSAAHAAVAECDGDAVSLRKGLKRHQISFIQARISAGEDRAAARAEALEIAKGISAALAGPK